MNILDMIRSGSSLSEPIGDDSSDPVESQTLEEYLIANEMDRVIALIKNGEREKAAKLAEGGAR